MLFTKTASLRLTILEPFKGYEVPRAESKHFQKFFKHLMNAVNRSIRTVQYGQTKMMTVRPNEPCVV